MFARPRRTPARNGLPLGKRLLFSFVSASMVLVAVEAFSFLALHGLFSTPQVAPVADLLAATGAIYKLHPLLEVDMAHQSPDAFNQVVHPYLGAVLEPVQPYVVHYGEQDWMENYGFGPYAGPFVREKREDTVVVGVFGGSVAKQFVTHGKPELLTAELAKLPKYAGKKFVLTVPTNYGYKQPQQLLTLNYLLSLGAHFDVIINLDGFNEVSMPYPENYSQNIFSFYPRSWNLRMQNLDHAPDMRRIIGRISLYRQELEELRAKRGHSLARHSMTAQLLWQVADGRLSARVEEQQQALLRQKADERSGYIVTGPHRVYQNGTEFVEDIVRVWKDSSLLMHRIAQSRGIDYYHVLQPNQYVANSKPMSPEEQARAINEQSHFRQGVVSAYGSLRSAGAELKASGVQFYDMTMVFADQPQPIYLDDCCHMTSEGSGILAQRLGEAIVAANELRP